MILLIKLHDHDGREVHVNEQHITAVTPIPLQMRKPGMGGALVALSGGHHALVRETVEQVLEKLGPRFDA